MNKFKEFGLVAVLAAGLALGVGCDTQNDDDDDTAILSICDEVGYGYDIGQCFYGMPQLQDENDDWFDFTVQEPANWMIAQGAGYCLYCGIEAGHFQAILDEFEEHNLRVIDILFRDNDHNVITTEYLGTYHALHPGDYVLLADPTFNTLVWNDTYNDGSFSIPYTVFLEEQENGVLIVVDKFSGYVNDPDNTETIFGHIRELYGWE